jgi:hypothetical protein
MHEVTIDINERGGKRFRQIFKDNLLTTELDENGNSVPGRFITTVISSLEECKNLNTTTLYYIKETRSI